MERTALIDPPTHGMTAGRAGLVALPGPPVAAYSSDLDELLDRLKIGQFACLGESNGGMVTLAVAATMAPRNVEHVIHDKGDHGSVVPAAMMRGLRFAVPDRT